MNEELRATLQRADESQRWINEGIQNLAIESASKWHITSAASLNASLSVGIAIVHLLHQTPDQYFPAFALSRVQFESLVKGMWLRTCCDSDTTHKLFLDNELKGNRIDKKGRRKSKELGEFIEDIESKPDYDSTIKISSYKSKYWNYLNSMTHCGLQAVARQVDNGMIRSRFSDADLEHLIKATHAYTCLAFKEIIILTDRMDVFEKFKRRYDA